MRDDIWKNYDLGTEEWKEPDMKNQSCWLCIWWQRLLSLGIRTLIPSKKVGSPRSPSLTPITLSANELEDTDYFSLFFFSGVLPYCLLCSPYPLKTGLAHTATLSSIVNIINCAVRDCFAWCKSQAEEIKFEKSRVWW